MRMTVMLNHGDTLVVIFVVIILMSIIDHYYTSADARSTTHPRGDYYEILSPILQHAS